MGGFDPVTFDSGCVESIRNAADKLGYSHRDLVSGAGHDACWINRVAPTAMVMCPCVDGLSHNEAEEIYPEWATAGANVLFHAVGFVHHGTILDCDENEFSRSINVNVFSAYLMTYNLIDKTNTEDDNLNIGKTDKEIKKRGRPKGAKNKPKDQQKTPRYIQKMV